MTLKKSRYFFEGDDLTEYASVIQEKIAEYNRVGHDDDRTDNLMDYFDGSAAIKEKCSVRSSSGERIGWCVIWLYNFRIERVSGGGRIIGTV